MLGSRAISLARLGQYEDASAWAIKAAARPNAHQHIMTIAALSLGLAGRIEEANDYKTRIRQRVPDYAMTDFLAAVRFSPDAEALFKQAGKKVGIV
jgi:Flp pilus assembly protein TadD